MATGQQDPALGGSMHVKEGKQFIIDRLSKEFIWYLKGFRLNSERSERSERS
jgi:hypothetical protein